jgi:NAD(P)-dependent dehydrogenase (short-subunit alcohol dehydrogenase family)
MKSFDGRMIFIPAAQRLGLEMGKIFAARGADVLLIARTGKASIGEKDDRELQAEGQPSA